MRGTTLNKNEKKKKKKMKNVKTYGEKVLEKCYLTISKQPLVLIWREKNRNGEREWKALGIKRRNWKDLDPLHDQIFFDNDNWRKCMIKYVNVW